MVTIKQQIHKFYFKKSMYGKMSINPIERDFHEDKINVMDHLFFYILIKRCKM